MHYFEIRQKNVKSDSRVAILYADLIFHMEGMEPSQKQYISPSVYCINLSTFYKYTVDFTIFRLKNTKNVPKTTIMATVVN